MNKAGQYRREKSRQLLIRVVGVMAVLGVFLVLIFWLGEHLHKTSTEKKLDDHRVWIKKQLTDINTMMEERQLSETDSARLAIIKTELGGLMDADPGPERRKKLENLLETVK